MVPIYFNSFTLAVQVSPDAFVQMALQLAYFRIYKNPCATYESASTRQFLHGRTETIRSCSNESVAFTKSFDQKDISVCDDVPFN
jgi:carnitine O-acetyltransferase